jgi:hypothetical protein
MRSVFASLVTAAGISVASADVGKPDAPQVFDPPKADEVLNTLR